MAEEKKATGLKLFNQTITNPSTQKYLADVLGERIRIRFALQG